MVIPAPRVARDPAQGRAVVLAVPDRAGRIRWPLVSPRQAHDAARAREDLLSVEAQACPAMRSQPSHLPLHACRDEGLPARGVLLEAHLRAGARDGDGVEPQIAPRAPHLLGK